MDSASLSLEEARQKHLGRLLLEAHRAFGDNFLRRLHQASPALRNVSITQVNVIAQIPLGGIRITDLAQRTGMTKQAVGQFVRALEDEGLIERDADPTDARAVTVGFTESGQEALAASLSIKTAIEAEYRALLGDSAFETLQSALVAIIEHEKMRQA